MLLTQNFKKFGSNIGLEKTLFQLNLLNRYIFVTDEQENDHDGYHYFFPNHTCSNKLPCFNFAFNQNVGSRADTLEPTRSALQFPSPGHLI